MTTVWHFTRIENLGSILRSGYIFADGMRPVHISHADNLYKARRRLKAVPVEPHGFINSYVPFYFRYHTPMLEQVLTGYGVPRAPAGSIVFFRMELVPNDEGTVGGRPAVISDRHPVHSGARFARCTPENLETMISSQMMAETNPFLGDKVRKQAELLVHLYLHVQAAHISLVVNSAETQKAVVKLLRENRMSLPVAIDPACFTTVYKIPGPD